MTIIEWLRDKNSTENKDNILAPCMDAQTAVNFLIDYLIGDDWYVAYPACTEQVNTEAVMFILQKFSRKYKKELKAWNRRCGDGMNMFDFACRQLSELFDAPCNYNDICDYMHERDEYFCPNCDKWAVWQCWKKYFELKYDDIYGK